MTTVTVVIDKDKKPQYKDYIQFLGSYKNGKKGGSDHSQSSSLGSDISDLNEMPTKSFNEYLQDYNNKKFQPVQVNFIEKNEEPKNVKTEVFIQINNNKANDNGKSKNQIKITIPKPKLDETDGDQIKVSVGKLSEKFNNNNSNNTTQTHFLRRSPSISEKTKIFEEKLEGNNSRITKINKANYIEKFPKHAEVSTKRSNGHKPNQTFVEIRKQEIYNCPRVNGIASPPSLPSGKTESLKNINSEITNNNINTSQDSEIFTKISSTNTNGHRTNTACSLPRKDLIEDITVIPYENTVKIEVKDCAIPPPPPLPPANLPPRPINVSLKFPNSGNTSPKPFNMSATLPKSVHISPNLLADPKIHTNGYSTLSKAQTGYSTLPKMQHNKKDTVDNSTIDRNDPRVKKMVYGALRGMYGAYHDKANDYLATLPKNRVKKDNGLDSIINSIAAQGGLEKLCGRSNPKSETDPV